MNRANWTLSGSGDEGGSEGVSVGGVEGEGEVGRTERGTSLDRWRVRNRRGIHTR